MCLQRAVQTIPPWYLDPWFGDAGIISCNGVLVLEAVGSIFDLNTAIDFLMLVQKLSEYFVAF